MSQNIGQTPLPHGNRDEHLWAELERIDQLVRAATVRWRAMIAEHKDPRLWGMVHVGDDEVKAYLESPFLPPDQLPSELVKVMDKYIADAGIKSEQLAPSGTPPPRPESRLWQLQTLFGLDRLELDILLVCLLPQLDARYRRLYGYLQDDASRHKPTVELILQILQPVLSDLRSGYAAFDANAPLVAPQLVLVNVEGTADEPPPMRFVRVDDRIASFLIGDDVRDARLRAIVSEQKEPVGWDELLIEKEQRICLKQFAAGWQYNPAAQAKPMMLFFHGNLGSGRLRAARAIRHATNKSALLVVNVEGALQAAEGWEQIVKLVYREALLSGAIVYWAGCEMLLDREKSTQPWMALVARAARHPGLTIFASQVAWDQTADIDPNSFLRFDFPTPGFDLRVRIWERFLPEKEEFVNNELDKPQLATALANSFQLNEGRVRDAIGIARMIAARRNPLRPLLNTDDLYEGCRRQSSRNLVSFTRRVKPRPGLDFASVILPETNMRQLEELWNRIKHSSRVFAEMGLGRELLFGKGLIALFTGSSGTGKTMAAEVLASKLGVDLYKVDLSAVVSKYVGETEKNLNRVFAEAEDSSAILFFDEADALFGKRGEVKEAQDRWANMEVNYLLQRVEDYAGTVILASNLRQNIDEAFVRRIHVIVEFPFPDQAARYAILQGLFPTDLPHPDDGELQAFSKQFELAGGNYRNIVIDAVFRALGENEVQPVVTLRHLVASAGREFEKLVKPITKKEFGPTYYEWVLEDILSVQKVKPPVPAESIK